MNLPGGGQHVHHHGLLAGIGAGAMAVLVGVPLLLWMVWHRIAGAVGTAAIVIVGVLVFAVCAAAAAALVYAVLWLRHKSRQFAAPVAQAQVLGSAAQVAALEPLRETHMHVHLPPGMAPEAVSAALRAVHPALPPGAGIGGPGEAEELSR